MRNHFAVCLLVMLASGCATSLSDKAALIKDADDKMVQNCKFLGNVEGTSGLWGASASIGVANAKNEAIEKASKLGATHVYWIEAGAGFLHSSASGRAYDCRDVAKPPPAPEKSP